MILRTYQPGDEQAQCELYNQATRSLPGYKSATVEDIARRYRSADADPSMRLYAVEAGKVAGYVTFNPNGRISYPWCLPGSPSLRPALLDAALSAMKQRGFQEAWAAYRADWTEPLSFLKQHGFSLKREWLNYVARVDTLPRPADSESLAIEPLTGEELGRQRRRNRELFAEIGGEQLESFVFRNEYFGPDAAFQAKEDPDRVAGIGLAISDRRFADPTKIDAAMPCFRLGAFGTETQRHKRVNGLFSCVFETDRAAEALLVEAARRFAAVGLTHAAAQAPSDQPRLVALYDRHFERQAGFPILARKLA